MLDKKTWERDSTFLQKLLIHGYGIEAPNV